MFGIGKRAGGGVTAVVDIASGSAGVAIITGGEKSEVLALARESLPLEKRSDDALEKGVLQALATAVEKAIKELNANGQRRISACYCIVGAPWTHSVPGKASSRSEKEIPITDPMIADLAKQALANQKSIERTSLLEANVVQVLLNGYATDEPAGKHADEVDVFTLFSDCSPSFKTATQETLARLMPDVPITWRSSARAALSASKTGHTQDSLIVVVADEATDTIVVRKGVLTDRALIPQGILQITSSFAPGKPAEETLALLDMLEKDQCEAESCKALEESMGKAEPELAHSFGETFGKLSSMRKLPEEMLLIAPLHLTSWASRFFSRIDFTQFTATTRPFSVTSMSAKSLQSTLASDPRLSADPGLSVACALVNTGVRS